MNTTPGYASNIEIKIQSLAANPKLFLAAVLQDTVLTRDMALLAAYDELALKRILMSVMFQGVSKKDIKDLERIVASQVTALDTVGCEDHEKKTIKEYIPSAPVSPEAVFPDGYIMAKNMSITRKTDSGGQTASPCPILISEISHNKDINVFYVTLAWLADSKWNKLTVEKKMIASKSHITQLSNQNLPVTTVNADNLIDFLFQYQQENDTNIKKSVLTSRLGWTDNRVGFLWGRHFLHSPSLGQASERCSDIRFKGADEGDEQFADGFISNGDFSVWTSLVNEMLEYPDVAFSVYASLAAPLLPILDVANFTLELCNPSSSGKTTALLLAASAWGKPNLDSGSFVSTWNGTANRIGRVASLVNGLPLFLDETKLARSQNKYDRSGSNLVTDTIYMIASGQDKGRATLQGTERLQPFRTILLTTGESPSLDLSNDGGSRGRIIDLWGNPFLKTDAESKSVVDKVNWTIRDHYGHAGPCLVQFILDNRSHWPLWKAAYREANTMLTQSEGMSPIEMRLGEYFAAVATAIPIIHAAIPGLRRDKPVRELLDSVWNRAKNEASSSDIGTKALELVYDWIVNNQERIFSPVLSTQGTVWNGKIFGAYWDQTSGDDWTFIGLTRDVMQEIMQMNRMSLPEVVRNWDNKGWLHKDDASKGYQKQVAIPGTSKNMKMSKLNLYCLKKQLLISTTK